MASDGLAVIALILVAAVIRWHNYSQPEYVAKLTVEIHSRAEFQRNLDYFTPQGRAVFKWLAEKSSDTPMSRTKVTFTDSIIRENVCDIGVQIEETSVTMRLLKTDHWRFHDIYLDKSGGKDIKLWVSYVKDHPYATEWTMFWK